ncbi:MAG TPA: enoyl-CoA hydratase, partial [Ilumatobacteraceae bacterium]
MPLNPDSVGSESEPSQVSWTSKDTLLYAVSLGCGTGELQYTTENTKDVTQQVLPTYPVVIPGGGGTRVSMGTFNPAMLVHGSQSVTLHQPLPVAGKATVTSKIAAMYDKGKAAVVVLETNAAAEDGSPLYTGSASLFIR